MRRLPVRPGTDQSGGFLNSKICCRYLGRLEGG